MKTNRRQFFQGLGAGAAGLGMLSPLGLASCTSASAEGAAEEDG
jgi:para-nitrobenzyl esterase